MLLQSIAVTFRTGHPAVITAVIESTADTSEDV
jgi:hypothetical protein